MTKHGKIALTTVVGVLALGLTSADAIAGADSFAIRAKRILTLTEDRPEIDDGVMVIRDGRIRQVGTSAEIVVPPDLPVLEFPDATITPGFVAAASPLGGAHRGDESVAAGYAAVDAFDRYGDYRKSLASGVTTVHLSPGGHRLLTGQGAVVRLGGPPASRILLDRADLTINFEPAAFKPPPDVTFPFPASADVAITPPLLQRPLSRLGQLLALDEAVQDALGDEQGDAFSLHLSALQSAWQSQTPLRIHADRAVDMLSAMRFLEKQKRKGYLVGGAEASRIAEQLVESKIPLIYQPPDRRTMAGEDIGTDPAAFVSAPVNFASLRGVPLAIASNDVTDVRLAAVRASRRGLDRNAALAAITRVPAEILGIDGQVGSLQAGKQADFLVLTGEPLDARTHVQRVYVAGHLSFRPPESNALVVKAGTVWAGPDNVIRDGEILAEDGKIVAVGQSVPHPPFARVIDVRPNGFVAPGLIDSYGHLGLDGDQTEVARDLRLSKLFAVADVQDLRVAASGVTTVAVAPHKVSASQGATCAAVKTAGSRRDDRILRDPAAVLFDVSKQDPLALGASLEKLLTAGQNYINTWEKYEKDLRAFLEKQKAGPDAKEESKGDEDKPAEQQKEQKPDPLTGTWEATITEVPVPDPVRATIEIQLIDSAVTGRVTQTSVGITGRLSGQFDGKHVSGEIVLDQEIPGFSPPIKIEVDLVGEDHLLGTVTAMNIPGKIDANRTNKTPVEFVVTSSNRRGNDGRPLPPKKDPNLEPLKDLIQKKIPAVVKVTTAAQVRSTLDVLVDKHKLPVTLLNAEESSSHAAELAEKQVPVIVPPEVIRQRDYRDYCQADDLNRQGVTIAFQSNAEDGARHLPTVVLFAVERGLDAESALRAMTIDAAKALKIDDRVGSLEAGKDADLVIFSGHPFEEAGQVLRVVVNGQEVRP